MNPARWNEESIAGRQVNTNAFLNTTKQLKTVFKKILKKKENVKSNLRVSEENVRLLSR